MCLNKWNSVEQFRQSQGGVNSTYFLNQFVKEKSYNKEQKYNFYFHLLQVKTVRKL